MEISDIIPPSLGSITFIYNFENTQLPQIFKYNIFIMVFLTEILFWIRCTISFMINALSLEMCALRTYSKCLGTVLGDIVRS
jgi:hypothetical protein